MLRTLELAVEYGDIKSFDADVIALKYAQSFYGADLAVASAISLGQEEMERLCPGVGDYRYVETYLVTNWRMPSPLPCESSQDVAFAATKSPLNLITRRGGLALRISGKAE